MNISKVHRVVQVNNSSVELEVGNEYNDLIATLYPSFFDKDIDTISELLIEEPVATLEVIVTDNLTPTLDSVIIETSETNETDNIIIETVTVDVDETSGSVEDISEKLEVLGKMVKANGK
jgi:hypothetical protein